MTGPVAWGALTLLVAAGLLLAGSVLRRVLARQHLASTLRAHAVLPKWMRTRPFAVALEAAQAIIGIAGVGLVAAGNLDTAAFRAIAGATSAFYLGFGAYLLAVYRRSGAVTCGCLGADDRVGAASIARALALSAGPAVLAVAGVAAQSIPMRLAVLGAAVLVAAMAIHLVTFANVLHAAKQGSGGPA